MADKALKILLVEDNEDDVLLIKESFEASDLKHAIFVVGDGVEALAYMQRQGRYGSMPRPDLMILDINLPKKDGFEVLKELKASDEMRHMPVVILTTSNRDVDIQRAYSEGASSFITKPPRFEELQMILRQFSTYWSFISLLPRNPHANADNGSSVKGA